METNTSPRYVKSFNEFFRSFFNWVRAYEKQRMSREGSSIAAEEKARLKHVKTTIVSCYKTIQIASDEYLTYFRNTFADVDFTKLIEEEGLDTLGDKVVFGSNKCDKKVSIGQLLEIGCSADRIFHFILLLHLTVSFEREEEGTESDYLGCLTSIKGEETAVIIPEKYAKIVEHAARLSKRIDEAEAAAEAAAAANDKSKQPFDTFFENTKIGKIAAELSESLKNDDSFANIAKGAEGGVEGLFANNSGALTDMIQKVSSTITQKIQDGSINQEELMSEAMGFMGKIAGGNDIMGVLGNLMKGGKKGNMDMSSLMKMVASMQGGGGGSKGNRRSTRDRLKKKLEKKNQAKIKDE
jgi:hypothetical protein